MAKTNVFVVEADLRNPFISLSTHAQKTGGIVPLGPAQVLKVLCSRSFSKIGKSVVQAVAVNMIDLMFSKFSCHVKPCKLMGVPTTFAYSDIPTWKFGKTGPQERTCDRSNLDPICSRNFPRENAGIRVIIEEFLKMLFRYFWFWHSRYFTPSKAFSP